MKDGKALGIWVKTQRSSKRQNTLEQRRLDLLEEVGFVWNMNPAMMLSSVTIVFPSASGNVPGLDY